LLAPRNGMSSLMEDGVSQDLLLLEILNNTI
jgi:hypothetical protein